MTPIFAQAAGAAGAPAQTNASGRLIDASSGIAARFEESTGLPGEAAVWSVNIIATIVILVAGYILSGFVRGLIRRVFARRKIDPTIAGFAGNLAHAAIMAFVIVTALGQMGVDTKSFAAIIAAAGLAVGLAFQGSLSNFAAGVLIIAFRPFKAGDVVNGAGIEGTVEELQIFSTTLNTADNKRIIVPNSALMAGTIINYTANEFRRVDLQFGIGAGQDLDRAHEVLLAKANADPRIQKTPAATVANVKFIELGTQIELRAWCRTGDYAGVQSDFIGQLPAVLAAAGVKGPDRTVFYVERK
jgi:small conductance mechanosensitive channel